MLSVLSQDDRSETVVALVQEGGEGVKPKAFLRQENPSETVATLLLGARRRKCVG